MVYYLKADKCNSVTITNICNWIRVAVYDEKNPKIYLICDNEQLIELLSEVAPLLFGMVEVMPSERDDDTLNELVPCIMYDNWYAAGYAHLTTFLHATRNGYTSFWNIDADDLYMAIPIDKQKLLLRTAENTAVEEKIHAFSLDMHFSKLCGKHWSFGVTYTDNIINWFEIMFDHINDYQSMKTTLKAPGKGNLDWYFTYLRQFSACRLESFYVENLRFVHAAGVMVLKRSGLLCSGIYYFKNKRFVSSALREMLGEDSVGDMPVSDESIPLDMQFNENECVRELCNYLGIGEYFDGGVLNVEEEICKKADQYLTGKRLENGGYAYKGSECLVDGRTIVLLPYSLTNATLPAYFWEMLAETLQRLGYRVVTAVGKRMIPVKGTEALVNRTETGEEFRDALAVISLINKVSCEIALSDQLLFVINTEVNSGSSKEYKGIEPRDGLMQMSYTSEDEVADIAGSILKCFV